MYYCSSRIETQRNESYALSVYLVLAVRQYGIPDIHLITTSYIYSYRPARIHIYMYMFVDINKYAPAIT